MYRASSASLNVSLNSDISLQEVVRVVNRSKRNKAVSLDKIPYEILKNDHAINMLHKLFQLCFSSGRVPSQWGKAIIKPIPKSSLSDPRVPLNYRGISLLSNISKLFSGILNDRLTKYLDSEKILVDEQNGFRKARTCLDHIYVLTSIIRNRKAQKLPTFSVFVDMKKAFDWVDRDLLFYKLLQNNINGRLYESIKSLYCNSLSCINVNGNFTPWFTTTYGVRQGDVLSPTLFSMFINDLAIEINDLGLGIPVGNSVINILLYADDIVMLAENETNLQKMIDHLQDWCKRWRMMINKSKTQIVHFRNTGQSKTNFIFHFDVTSLDIVAKYKYLGLVLDQFLNFDVTAETLSAAAGRALGSVISKIHRFKDFRYNTFTTLFHSCVTPILDYCSAIWGYRFSSKCESIQNRAMRYFLGVHKFAPVLAINGDMGWDPCLLRNKLNMVRLWNRLIAMSDERLIKQVFTWDISLKSKNWSRDMFDLFSEIGLQEKFNNLEACSIAVFKDALKTRYISNWMSQLSEKPKLRTYLMFKTEYGIEKYLKLPISRSKRSLLAQLRVGILPLKIETGRYTNVPKEERMCDFCPNAVEDELHFVFDCNIYNVIRNQLFAEARNVCSVFDSFDVQQKLKFLMCEMPSYLASYVNHAFQMRREASYT